MSIFDKYFKNKKDKDDFFIALPVVALFFGGIIYAIFPNAFSTSILSDNIQIATFSEKEIDKNIPIVENVIVYSDIDKIDEMTSNQQRQMHTWLDSLKIRNIHNTAIVSFDSTLIATNEEVQDIQYVVAGNDTLNEEVASTDSLKEEEVLIENETITLEESPIVEIEDTTNDFSELEHEQEEVASEYTDENDLTSNKVTKTLKKPCIIMLGAFEEFNNANKLIKRLLNDAYSIYVGYEKGYKVVGIRSICEENQLNANLEVIKEKYSEDAFILTQ